MAAHESIIAHSELPMHSSRSFGFLMAVVFVLIGLLPLMKGMEVRWWAVAAALVLALCAGFAPALLSWPNLLWFRLGLALAKITTPVVMGILFFFLITPIAVVGRLSRRNPLRLRFNRNAQSYWITRDAETEFKASGMKYQF